MKATEFAQTNLGGSRARMPSLAVEKRQLGDRPEYPLADSLAHFNSGSPLVHAVRETIPNRAAPGELQAGELQIRDFHIQTLTILAQTLLQELSFLEVDVCNGRSPGLDLQSQVRKFEAAIIRSALQKTGGRQRRAARLLGMKVTTLNTKIKRYKLDRTLAGPKGADSDD